MQVTVVGLGAMGSALAARLATQGHDVMVWNRSPGKAGPAIRAGAVEAASLAEAVDSAQVVMTMLADDQAVRSVALGQNGLAELIGQGLYIDCSTVSPALAAELEGRFSRFAAMPVLGSPEAVRAGHATLLVGSVDSVADEATAIARSLSESHVRFPEARLALAAKVTCNYLLLSGLPVLAEAMAIGRAGGLGDDDLRRLLSESPLVAPALRNRFAAVLEASTDGWFSIALGAKDVDLALSLAPGADSLPVGRAVKAAFEAAAEMGLSDADVAGVARLYRDDSPSQS